MTIAKESLRFTGFFESELLLELMFRFWKHPLADDREFRNASLERAVSVLQASVAGTTFLEGLQPANMNLVAAIWYGEWSSLEEPSPRDTEEITARRDWLDRVRRAVPSCFCDPELLD